jgi:hypothetical protein
MGISRLDVNQGHTTDKQNEWAVTSGNKVYDRKKGHNFDNITNKSISLQMCSKLLIDKWQFSHLLSQTVYKHRLFQFLFEIHQVICFNIFVKFTFI